MDEVRANIQGEQTLHNPDSLQSTLEEITLEEFLVQAGIVKELEQDSRRVQNDHGGENGFINHGLGLGDMNHGNIICTKSGPSSQGLYHGEGGNMRVVGFGTQRLEMGSTVSQVSVSAASTDHGRLSVEHVGGLGLFGREEVGGKGKWGLNDMIGRVVVVERQKRRMIKNRESAARSRARKLAYTLELEVEVNQLKEENAQLQQDKQRFWEETRHLLLQLMDENARIDAPKTTYAHRRYNSCS